jgi:hypothetical protein
MPRISFAVIGAVLIAAGGLLVQAQIGPQALMTSVAAASSASRYPPAFYPPLIPLRHGVIWDMSRGCPNPMGLREPGSPTRATTHRIVLELTSGRLMLMRYASDARCGPTSRSTRIDNACASTYPHRSRIACHPMRRSSPKAASATRSRCPGMSCSAQDSAGRR